jgi:hypothetical protein
MSALETANPCAHFVKLSTINIMNLVLLSGVGGGLIVSFISCPNDSLTMIFLICAGEVSSGVHSQYERHSNVSLLHTFLPSRSTLGLYHRYAGTQRALLPMHRCSILPTLDVST